jgi:protease IV
MKKFLLGLLSGFMLAALAAVIVGFALMRAGDRRAAVPDASLLVMRLEGEIPELAAVTIPLPWFESQAQSTVADFWMLLRQAEKDNHIKAILMEPRGIGAGWAKLDELRAGIRQFKKSGKPVYAYLRNPGAREYYLATAADKIYFNPEDMLDLKGMRAELSFYRRTLDKVGVELEVEHAGKYKDAADSFVRTGPTPETREVIDSILDQVFGHLVDSIAAARKLEPAGVRALIDDGPFLDNAALSAKLIDGLLYEDQVRDELKKQLKVTTLERLSHRDYLRSAAFGGSDGDNNRIALVVGEGAISRAGGDADPFSDDEGIRSGPFMRLLRQVREDSTIKGVVLRVNSPGGDAIASDEILHEVKLLAQAKPLVVSMSDVAASGGYYIAMTGDPVVAYPNTITGSIGVIYGKLNLKGLYDKLGVDTEIIKRGRNADFDSAIRPMSEAARKKLREGIFSTYQAFLERVAEGRKRKVGDIEPLAQGRVWMGAQAKGNGLVDQLGGLDQAIELVRQKAKIAAGEKIRLVPFPRKRTLFDQIFNANESVVAWFRPPTSEALALRAARQWTRQLGLDGLDPASWAKGGIFCLPSFSLRLQ